MSEALRGASSWGPLTRGPARPSPHRWVAGPWGPRCARLGAPCPTRCSPIGLFGTGIQSYFTFLRFLLMLNLLTVLLTSSFVLLPLVWLRPPGPGPALNLSERLGSPHPLGPWAPSLGSSRGLHLTSLSHGKASRAEGYGVGGGTSSLCLGDPFLLAPSLLNSPPVPW